jgi:hypothetical protein
MIIFWQADLTWSHRAAIDTVRYRLDSRITYCLRSLKEYCLALVGVHHLSTAICRPAMAARGWIGSIADHLT